MDLNKFISEIEWNSANRVAIIFSFFSLVIGLTITELHSVAVIGGALGPLLMIYVPWFWVWDVPRRYFYEEAPREYVLVFGWFGLIVNFIYVIYKIKI